MAPGTCPEGWPPGCGVFAGARPLSVASPREPLEFLPLPVPFFDIHYRLDQEGRADQVGRDLKGAVGGYKTPSAFDGSVTSVVIELK